MKITLLIFMLIQTILSADADSLEKIKLQLQWKYQFQFAGFIMAKELGYYKDVGLDVDLIEYHNNDILDDLKNEKVDYVLSNSIISYEHNILHKTTLIATYFQRSPLVIVTQSDIKSILDLQNKKIMISKNEYFNSSLTTLLEHFEINKQTTTFVSPTYNINDFIEKKVDATTAFRSNELFELNKQNISYNIIDPVEYGFPTSANNLFTSQKRVHDNPEQIYDFLAATKKGWEYALNNIQAVAKIIHIKYQKNESIEHLVYEGEITKQLMLLDLYDIGEINKGFVKKVYKQLIKNNKLNPNQSSDKLILEKEDLQSWIKQKYIQRTEYTFALLIAGFFIILLMLIFLWSLKIKQEIKKRYILQNAYKEERDKNELYLDTTQVLIVALDSQARVTMLNKKGEELLGYTEEELLGKVWFEIGVLPKDIEQNVSDFFDTLLSLKEIDDTSFEHLLISKSGKEIMLSFRNSLLFDENNNVIGILSSGSDITKRLKAEQEIQKQHDFLQTIINSVGSGIMVIHKDYSVPLMNNAARAMIDNQLIQDPLSPKCYEISHQDKEPCNGMMHPCPLEKVLNTKEATKVIHTHLNSLNGKKIVELTAIPLFDADGEIIGIVESSHDITELKQVQDELKHQAEHDSLTGLPNRVLFLDRLNQSIKNAARYKINIAVLFIDIDNFKNVNDSLGHNIGDLLLKAIAEKLSHSLRQSDTVARLGGDEFAIILEHFNHNDVVISVIQTIMQSLKKPLEIDKQQLYTTLSLGISIYPEDGIDSTTLIKNADTAMYRAKNKGRNNYQFYTADMADKALKKILLETELRQSLQNNQLEVYYQLQINSLDESIIGMEALVRWNHPEKGLVSPALFIPLAEESGFITELDEWVMKKATEQFKDWHNKSLNPGILSLNLATQRLEEDGFIQKINDMLDNSQAIAKWLSFEITETKIMQNPEKSIEHLNELSKLGIKLSIDDFGTGYSSLSYLKRLPINKLKIDQSFIRDIPDDLDDIEITKTIIAMAKNLKLDLIAEGVETKEQKDFLIANGCTEVQGFFYHKPSPAKEIEKRLKTLLS